MNAVQSGARGAHSSCRATKDWDVVNFQLSTLKRVVELPSVGRCVRLSLQTRFGIVPEPIPEILQVFFNVHFDSIQVKTGGLVTLWLPTRKKVIFDFRLCTRRTHRDT